MNPDLITVFYEEVMLSILCLDQKKSYLLESIQRLTVPVLYLDADHKENNLYGAFNLSGHVLDTSAVGDVLDGVGSENSGNTELVRARRLVGDRKVESAGLVVTPGASRVENVVESVMLSNKAARLAKAAGQVVHAVGSGEGKATVRGVDKARTLRGRYDLIVGSDSSTSGRIGSGRLSSRQVVPGVIRDVVSATGLVDVEKIDGSISNGNLDADVVAVDRHGPVGNTVGINLAAQNTDGRRVLLVGSNADADSGGDRSASNEGVNLGKHLVEVIW